MQKKIKIPKKDCIPLLGVAPRDPRVWPLEAWEGLTKVPRYPLKYDLLCQNVKIFQKSFEVYKRVENQSFDGVGSNLLHCGAESMFVIHPDLFPYQTFYCS